MLPESSQIRAVSGLLNVRSPLHFLALALVMLVPPLCLLFREPVIEAAGTRNWMVVVVMTLSMYFGIFLGFLVLALRDPRLVTVPRARQRRAARFTCRSGAAGGEPRGLNLPPSRPRIRLRPPPQRVLTGSVSAKMVILREPPRKSLWVRGLWR